MTSNSSKVPDDGISRETTVIAFVVKVPVLSLQLTEVHPSVSTDGKARVHQATDRRLLREFALTDGSAWLQSLAFHAPSGQLATGVHDGTVRGWDSKSGKLLKAFNASPH